MEDFTITHIGETELILPQQILALDMNYLALELFTGNNMIKSKRNT